MTTNDFKMNPSILKIDSKKLLSLIDDEQVELNDDVAKEVMNILNKTILDDSEDNINISYEDICIIIEPSKDSYITSFKIYFKTNLEINFVDLAKQILQVVNTDNGLKGIILNIRSNLNFDLSNISDCIEHLIKRTDESNHIIWSSTIDNKIKDYIEVTTIVSI